jgi:coenzyme F420-reducing hydrogenase beta subunit
LSTKASNVLSNIDLGFCSFCGACISICPTHVGSKNLDYISEKYADRPVVKDSAKCEKCRHTLCMQICPQINISKNLFDVDSYSYIEAYYSKSRLPEVLSRAQDGGTATTLLITALRAGFADYAIVIKRDDEWHSKPMVTRNEDDILEASGSKYIFSPLLSVLDEITDRIDFGRIAIVGIPCQLRALENIAMLRFKHNDIVAVKIGLFCMHGFSRDRIESILNELNITFRDVVKMNIKKGKLWFATKDGKLLDYPLKKAEKVLRPACRQCPELFSPYADINVGSIAAEENWNTLLVMTSKGKELVEKAISMGLLETKPMDINGIETVNKYVHRKTGEALKNRELYTKEFHNILLITPTKRGKSLNDILEHKTGKSLYLSPL